jgi:hypothetical protein
LEEYGLTLRKVDAQREELVPHIYHYDRETGEFFATPDWEQLGKVQRGEAGTG